MFNILGLEVKKVKKPWAKAFGFGTNKMIRTEQQTEGGGTRLLLIIMYQEKL